MKLNLSYRPSIFPGVLKTALFYDHCNTKLLIFWTIFFFFSQILGYLLSISVVWTSKNARLGTDSLRQAKKIALVNFWILMHVRVRKRLWKQLTTKRCCWCSEFIHFTHSFLLLTAQWPPVLLPMPPYVWAGCCRCFYTSISALHTCAVELHTLWTSVLRTKNALKHYIASSSSETSEISSSTSKAEPIKWC